MDKSNTEVATGRVGLFGTYLMAACLIAAADLASKWAMVTMVMDPPRVIPVTPFFNLVLVFNRGVSFGLLGDLGPWGPLLLSALAVGIMGFLLVWLRRTEHPNEAIGIVMILGGAAGNLIDRLHDGAVTDFLDLYVGKYHWPSFNGADIFIVMGALCLIISSIGSDKRSPREQSKPMIEQNSRSHTDRWGVLFAAWLIALGATLGALFIGEVMGQTPCVLCWYQRAFMFPLAIVLAVACFRSDRGGWFYALPLAIIGWLIAGYHLLLYIGVISEEMTPCRAGPSCSDANMTILGGIPIPLLSIGAFTVIILLLFIFRKRTDT